MHNNFNVSTTAKDIARKTILIIENDEALAGVLKLVISVETQHRVFIVPDGSQALSLLHDTSFDMILLDYDLPQLGGFTLYTLIRTIKGQEEIPIIFLGSNIPQDAQDEIVLRQIAVIDTPFELDNLFAVLDHTLAA